MTYFLFEMQNAKRALKYKKARDDAAKKVISEDSYIYFMCQYEVEGMLQLGQMWDEIITGLTSIIPLEEKTSYLYKTVYLPYKNKIKTLGQTIQNFRYSRFLTGETRQDYYKQQYYDLISGTSAISLAQYPLVGVA